MKVRNIYDREGHTEQEIMTQAEIEKTVNKWLEENSFADLLRENGIFRESQSFGNANEIVIDTRDGAISHHYSIQNQMSADCPFYITLVRLAELDKDDSCICEGCEMEAEITMSYFLKNIKDNFSAGIIENEKDAEYYLEYEKLENGKIRIAWRGNEDYISAEDFVTKFMHENWDEWESDYEYYCLSDIDTIIAWESEVAEYYTWAAGEESW